jgi:hypothetical protein
MMYLTCLLYNNLPKLSTAAPLIGHKRLLWQTSRSLLILAAFCFNTTLHAQLTGVYTVPGSYTSVAQAVSQLNTLGVSSGVTINIAAGYTETVAPGGLVLNTISGASSGNQIVFQKSGAGANPLLTAYAGGTAVPSSAQQDGVWRLNGSDFITIDGIDISDPNTSNPATMEFGYGFFKTGPTNGCQNNIIRNCVITLNRINNAAGALPAADGSRGIEMTNALSGSHTTSVAVSSPAGANSANKFYSNTIQNCNTGISIISQITGTNSDINNEIGGNSSTTGNTIINYGGGGSASPAQGIRTLCQKELKIRYNSINNNTGAGFDHAEALRGIAITDLEGAAPVINNNTITLHGAGTTQNNIAIESSRTAFTSTLLTVSTFSVMNNLITNCTYSTATSGHFYGIRNSICGYTFAVLNNTLTNNSTAATSGTFASIYNAGDMGPNALIPDVDGLYFNDNLIDLGTFSAPATSLELFGICSNIQTVSNTGLQANANTFRNCNYAGSTGGTGPVAIISIYDTEGKIRLNGNTFNNLVIKTSGDVTFLRNNNNTFPNVVTTNSITGSFSKPVAGGTVYGYYCSSTYNGDVDFSNNNYSNITLAGATSFYGYWESSNRLAHIKNNIISNVSTGSGTLCGIYNRVLYSDIGGNTVSGLSNPAGAAWGLYSGTTPLAASSATVYNNQVYSLSSGAGENLYGIYLIGTNQSHIYRNKVYDLSGSHPDSRVTGIYCNATNSVSIYNNIIGDLRAAAATSSSVSVTGIELFGGHYNKLYYNTVRLNAISSGASFGSAAVFVQPGTAFEMRNNIFINLSAPTGTAVTAAFMGNATTANQYLAVSNRNLFYAGTPATNRVIYSDGAATFSTLVLYKAALSTFNIDANSVTENVPFLSTTGSAVNFLHIDPTIGSQVESGAAAIATYTNDFDGQVRYGNTGYTGTGTAPDIGADEYNQDPCTQGSSGTLSASTLTLCEGQTFTASASNNSLFQGITYYWKVATTSGGPYTNVIGGNGATGFSYTTGAVSPSGTLYYVLSSTCAATGSVVVSNQLTVTVNPFPTATLSANSNTLCSSQSLSLMAVSNGTSFLWAGPNFGSTLQNPVIPFVGTPFNSGTYSVTITSAAGCVKKETIPVLVVPFPTITAVAVPSIVCAGVTTTLYASSSNATFTWSSQQTSSMAAVSPTASTVYTVSSLGLPCPVVTATVAVFVHAQPNLTITSTPTAVCAGVPSTLNVTGATTYSWSTGSTNSSVFVTPASSGYSVTGWDSNGCTATLAITTNSVPVVSILASAGAVCPGASVNFTATGAPSYLWSNGASTNSVTVQPSANQVYTVTGTNAEGCSTSATIAANTLSVPVIQVSPTLLTVCELDVIQLTGSGSVTNYTWSPGSHVAPTFTGNIGVTTVFTVSGTGLNNCTNVATATIEVTPCVGIEEQQEQYGMFVYPNPSGGMATLKMPVQGKKRIVISDVSSVVIRDVQTKGEEETIDLSDRAKGLYFVRVYYNGAWLNFKLIVQ